MNLSEGQQIFSTGDFRDMVKQNVKVKILEAKKIENAERGNNFEVEKVGRGNSIICNHKDSESIQLDLNHTNSNQSI